MRPEQSLEHMPILRRLLINYVTFTFQEDAVIDAESLVQEYRLLLRENRLHDLFVQEFLDNTHGLEDSEWLTDL